MRKIANLPILISVLALTIVGSFVSFYCVNLVMSDVSNMFYGAHDIYFISSIPGFIFSLLFIIAVLFIARYYLHPKARKRMCISWISVALGFGIVGLVTSILTGTIVYHSFTKPFPFPFYTIICLIFYILFVIAMIVLLILVIIKMPEDKERRKITLRSAWHTTWLSLLLVFSFNRFGAFLWSPVYIHWRTFYLTWPYYIWLLMPMVLVYNVMTSIFGVHQTGTMKGIKRHSFVLAIAIILSAVNVGIGVNNTQFISAVSPTVAIERLATLPIDTIVQFLLLFGFELYFLIREVKKYRERKLLKQVKQ